MHPVNNSHNCQVVGCNSCAKDVVMYSVKRSKDREKYLKWLKILNITSAKSCIYACQRHFPAGAPTKNHPDPNPRLFNPIPDILLESDCKIPSLFESEYVLQCTDGKYLPPPALPPPGTILKLAPNATLIDLKKLKEQDFSKPFRIEEVTVMIDDKDSVKVVDYGPKDDFLSSSVRFRNSKFRKSRKPLNQNLQVPADHEANIESFVSNIDESTFEHFYEPSLGNVLENMRQLRIDCNTVVVDITKRYAIYAHTTILISKSPYFFKQLYLKRKKEKKLYQFCQLTLPTEVDCSVVDAVVSYIYTGSLQFLLENNSKEVKKLLFLLEMKDTLELYEQEINEEIRIGDDSIRMRPVKGDAEESVFILPCLDGNEEKTSVIEVGEDREREKKRKKKLDDDTRREVILSKEDFFGRLKVSVQKIVDNALNPFLGKIEELFDPSGTTLNIAKTSQHIITLWHADILLTKLFDQSELTKFFSDVMNELLEKSPSSIINKNLLQSKYENVNDLQSGSYTVESLSTQTGNCLVDDSYSKPAVSDSTEAMESLTVDDMQIITNYQQVFPKQIPLYVHMIAIYRYNIFMKKKDLKQNESTSRGKDDLMPSLLETDAMNDDANSSVVIEDLVNHMDQDTDLINNFGLPSLTKSCFQQVIMDLKRRVIADLELYINPAFHEELIMHIIVDQMDDKNVLPLTLGIFLAKGCNFCRKKECKSEDLTMPITSDNPVCPDRECIKQNLNCFICHKQMSTSKSLARHKYGVHDIQTGDTSGLFICSHCGETFSKKWKLNMHEREHEDRKVELFCRYCKKKIRGTIALKKHVSMVHEAKPQFVCDFCPKAFKRRETLSVHRRIHTREKPFRCNYCDYASETKGNLKAHVFRKHKRPFITNSELPQQQIHGDHTQISIADENNEICEQDVDQPVPDDQVMAATIVAHSLSDGSFIITSENSPSSVVP